MMDEPSEIIEKKRCFIITPIGSDQSDERRHANMVFEIAFKPSLEVKGYSVERADLVSEPGQITAAIFSAINESDLCIADLTFLNANVMYELGVRHALQKPVIQVALMLEMFILSENWRQISWIRSSGSKIIPKNYQIH
jgi:exopolyphosphatase/pppGpp-phosphohydrolase